LKCLQSRAETYCEPWRSALLRMKEGTHVPHDRAATWENITAWDNKGGRVTLAGDAAHPVMPYRGQGLNLSSQDSGEFVEMVKKVYAKEKEAAEAVSAYDENVLERGKKEIKLTKATGETVHRFDRILNSRLPVTMKKEKIMPVVVGQQGLTSS